jgi:uncharacterized protein
MKYRAYIDIETTGLSRRYCDLTIIGIGLEDDSGCRVVQLLEDDINEAHIFKVLKGVDEIYSYNGRHFDLPFIKARLGVDLSRYFKHTDLMYDCWRQKLKGGLKVVERLLCIERKITGVDGFMAVQLWWDYVNNLNRESLHKLLAYNREDVVNLQLLRQKLGVA